MEDEQRTGTLRRSRTWKGLMDRLALIGCCGIPSWLASVSTTLDPIEEEEEEEEEEEGDGGGRGRFTISTYLRREHEADQEEASPTMSLAMAMAAEREFRSAVAAAEDEDEEVEEELEREEEEETPTVARVSLMTLLEETDGQCVGEESMRTTAGSGEEWWRCCVCMSRKKGAAFIPCGHTFCRVCCRELWLIRRRCPLCNRTTLDILDIY